MIKSTPLLSIYLLFSLAIGQTLCAQTYTLDFDTDANGNAIQAGQVIDDEYSAWGIQIEARNYQKSFNLAIAFDSANPTGGDYDLRTGPGAYGTGNNRELYNVLIISERNYDGNNDGLIDVPDDEGGRPAGRIDFKYDETMIEGSIALLDIEGSEPGAISFWNNGIKLDSKTIAISGLGDNSLQDISFGGFEFDHVRVFLKGSGAIGEITTVQVPEPEHVLLLSVVSVVLSTMKRRREQIVVTS